MDGRSDGRFTGIEEIDADREESGEEVESASKGLGRVHKEQPKDARFPSLPSPCSSFFHAVSFLLCQ